MVEPAQELTGGNLNTQHISLREDHQMIVEKELIAELEYQKKEDLREEIVTKLPLARGIEFAVK